MRRITIAAALVMLLIAALAQWGLDRTPAGGERTDAAPFPTASGIVNFLGGARQYLAFTFYIKADELHHAYYGSFEQEAELIPYFKLIALLDPNYISAYYVGAGIIDAQGRWEEALEFNLQGIRANPASADLYYSLGDLYLEKQRYEEAREAFERALEYGPEIVSRNTLLASLAAANEALGDDEGARRALIGKALYNQIRLYREGLTYGEAKVLVSLVNDDLSALAGMRGPAASAEGGE